MEQEPNPTPSRPVGNPARVVDIPLDELTAPTSRKRDRTPRFNWQVSRRDLLVDAGAIACVLIAFWAATAYLKPWFSSSDRYLVMAFVFAGALIGAIRGKHAGPLSNSKIWAAAFFSLLGVTSVGWAIWTNESRLALFGLFASISTWSLLRIRGESVAFAISLASVALLPLLIEAFDLASLFDTLQWRTVTFASGVSDMLSIPHVRESTTIVYGFGTADAFEIVGTCSGLLTLLGLAGFSILAFRRALLCSVLLTISTVFIWGAARSVTWIIIAIISERSQVWTAWSTNIEIASFAISALLVLCVDHWLACVLAPIPTSMIVNDYPLFSLLWNWVCSLPKLEIELPPTHHGLDSSPDAAESLELE